MSNPYFTTVASFETAIAAWIHCNYLRQNGLSALVTDEHTVNMYWLYSTAIGGVKVQIPQSEIADYRLLLVSLPDVLCDGPAPDDFDVIEVHGDDFTTCPECKSIEISIAKWPKRFIFLIWLILGFPIPVFAPVMTCHECGFHQHSKFDIPRQFRIIHLLILMTIAAMVLGVSMTFGASWR